MITANLAALCLMAIGGFALVMCDDNQKGDIRRARTLLILGGALFVFSALVEKFL